MCYFVNVQGMTEWFFKWQLQKLSSLLQMVAWAKVTATEEVPAKVTATEIVPAQKQDRLTKGFMTKLRLLAQAESLVRRLIYFTRKAKRHAYLYIIQRSTFKLQLFILNHPNPRRNHFLSILKVSNLTKLKYQNLM